jgi:hypothetical protein
MWKPTLALIALSMAAGIGIGTSTVERKTQSTQSTQSTSIGTVTSTSTQYWYAQRLDDRRVLVVCDNGTSADPADATIMPTDVQNQIIVDCGTREADGK